MRLVVLLQFAPGFSIHRGARPCVVAAEVRGLPWPQVQELQEALVLRGWFGEERLALDDVYLGAREVCEHPFELLGVVTAMPWVPSTGTMVRAVRPAETVVKDNRSAADSAVPA